MTDGITLRDYIERVVSEHERRNYERFASLEALIEARLQALALAVEKQERAYNARFEGVNEFRQSLDDTVKRSVTRESVDVRFDELMRRVSRLENENANRTGQAIGYAAGVGLVMLIISIVASYVLLGGG